MRWVKTIVCLILKHRWNVVTSGKKLLPGGRVDLWTVRQCERCGTVVEDHYS